MEYYDHWKKELVLDNKYKIKGFSRGSLRTGFILFPTNIFLDAGVPCIIKPNIILITHGHQDHIDSLYNHLLNTPNKVQVIGTASLINNLKEYLNSCRSMNVGYKIKFNNWDPKPILTNLNVEIKNTKYHIEGIFLDHAVECIGYGINEIRIKLKEKYKLYSKEEIIKIKKTENITEIKHIPILFFCGDMNNTSLSILPFKNYPYFIIECTFFDEEHLLDARRKKHLHIYDLIPYFNSNTDTQFILIHFSCKYTIKQIKKFETKYSFTNVIFWV
jgi:ribonuclease Z